MTPHTLLLMDAQSIYGMPSASRCLVFVMLIAAPGIDRPQRRSMTTFLRKKAYSLAALLSNNKIISQYLLQKVTPPLMAAAGYGPAWRSILINFHSPSRTARLGQG